MTRSLLYLLVCQSLLAQNGAAPDPATLGRVEGRVLNSATGEPLRKAQLTLQGGNLGPGEYMATSDANGAFAIERVPPGSYNLSIQHQNFAVLNYGSTRPGMPGKRLTVAAGQSVSGLEIKMIPFGVISGKVVDADGDPVAGVPLTVLRWSFVRGMRQLIPASNGTTNDRGEYRVYNLPAGRYLIAGRPNQLMDYSYRASTGRAFAATTIQREAPREVFALTFYPSAVEAAGASPVTVAPGQEVLGLDIQLRKTRIYRVQGKLSGAEKAGRYSVSMQPQDAMLSGSFGLNQTAAVRQDDWSFVFRGAAPGRYTLTAMVENRIGSRQEITIGSADLEGLVLPILEPGTIKGRVIVEAEANKPNPKGVRVSLVPAEGVPMNAPNASAGDDGSFSMTDVSPDRYHVISSPVDGAYLKTIRWGGQIVNEGTVEMASGGSTTLDLVFSPTSAVIEGDVKTSDDQPAAGATVLLLPASKRESDFRMTMADQNGHFNAKSMAPGSYSALATDAPIFSLPDAQWVKAMEKVTTSVNLDENGHATATLKLVPETDLEALQ